MFNIRGGSWIVIAMALACDSNKGDETGTTGAATDTTAATSTAPTSSDSSTGTPPVMIDCGADLTCIDEVCVETVEPPACVNEVPPDGCPGGTTETNCGGDGHPCCCEPAPPAEYRCAPPTGCVDVPACACLTMLCQDGKECLALDVSGQHFRCELPPAP